MTTYTPGWNFRPVVYRLYDADDRLIYIGASHHLPERMRAHELSSWFYSLIYRLDYADYPTRFDALAAEAVAIQEEAPVFNVRHRQEHYRDRDFADWTAEDIHACREWLRTNAIHLVPQSVRDFLHFSGIEAAA